MLNRTDCIATVPALPGVAADAPLEVRLKPDTSTPVHDMIRVGFLEDFSNMALLTARAAAERMGIGYSTLKQWIRLGKVRTTQTAGGHHRLAEAEVDRLLAHHAPDAPAAGRNSDRPAGLIVALSGRNQLRGFVEEVRIDGLLGQVRLRIGDQRLTAIITADALSVLKLRRGDSALAIVKATEVMVAREADAVEAPTTRKRRPR